MKAPLEDVRSQPFVVLGSAGDQSSRLTPLKDPPVFFTDAN